jgi:hypothetical protein
VSTGSQAEGLRLARLFMVVSSLSPVFVLWAIRGIAELPDEWVLGVCGFLAVIPNLFLLARIHTARKNSDRRTLTVGRATDHREHLLVYLFAVLIPLYDVNLSSRREVAAVVAALLFVIFLFWHLNLHYTNIGFAIFGYRVFTVDPPQTANAASGKDSFVIISARSSIRTNEEITALRLSNTVYFEPKGKV